MVYELGFLKSLDRLDDFLSIKQFSILLCVCTIMGLSFYVNCYFQSDSLKSNSLTSEVKEGPQEVVHEFKITSLFS